MKNRYYQGPVTDHFDGRCFYNPKDPHKASFGGFLKWRWTAKPKPWPEKLPNPHSEVPVDRVYGNDLKVTWIGHVTFLIQTQGLNILTDPVFGERASPLSFLGPKRVHAPGINLDHLPPLDLILVSHNHYDHLDGPSLRKLSRKHNCQIITPLGNDVTIRKYSPNAPVKTMDWGDQVSVNEDVSIHLTPSVHWSSRRVIDRNHALWGSFVIDTPGGKILFIGDSAYGTGEVHKSIGEQFKEFRLALIPIGAYHPRWFLKHHHMDPQESIQVFKDLNAKYAIPSHYQTFQLTDEGYEEPLAELKDALRSESSLLAFYALGIGESIMVPD